MYLIPLYSGCNETADIGLVIDASSSINFDPLTWNSRVLPFLVLVVNSFAVSDTLVRFGVVVFSGNAEVKIELRQYSDGDLLAR